MRKKKPKLELSYTKDDLLELLKRHSLKEGYKCCPFSANSVVMLVNFVLIEEDEMKQDRIDCILKLVRNITTKQCFIGKSRLVIAASLFYIATHECYQRYTQTKVAQMFYVAVPSIRETYSMILINYFDLIAENSEFWANLKGWEHDRHTWDRLVKIIEEKKKNG